MENKSFLESPLPTEKYPIRVKPITPATDNTPDYPLHRHEHIEFLYVTAGECTVMRSGERIRAKGEDFVIVNFNEIHATEMSEDCRLICVQISPVFFSRVSFESPCFKSHVSGDARISEFMHRILDEHNSNKPCADMEIMGICYSLMSYLVRNYTERRDETHHTEKRAHKISEIIGYVSAHYAEHLTTARLAEHFFLSEYYFCRFFKESTGLTPTDYINKYRVACAASLIKSTDLPITEIALRVGFVDSNYFTKIFKKYKGKTPREFKKI